MSHSTPGTQTGHNWPWRLAGSKPAFTNTGPDEVAYTNTKTTCEHAFQQTDTCKWTGVKSAFTNTVSDVATNINKKNKEEFAPRMKSCTLDAHWL